MMDEKRLAELRHWADQPMRIPVDEMLDIIDALLKIARQAQRHVRSYYCTPIGPPDGLGALEDALKSISTVEEKEKNGTF